jgi:hypothetical protein
MAGNLIIYANDFDYCPTAISYAGNDNSNSVGKITGNIFDNGTNGIVVSTVGNSLTG